MASFLVIDKMMRWFTRTDQQHGFTSLVFEQGDKHKNHLVWLIEQVTRKRPTLAGDVRKTMRKALLPRFDTKALAGLQLADFIAWEHKHLARQRLALADHLFPGVRPTFLELHKFPASGGSWT